MLKRPGVKQSAEEDDVQLAGLKQCRHVSGTACSSLQDTRSRTSIISTLTCAICRRKLPVVRSGVCYTIHRGTESHTRHLLATLNLCTSSSQSTKFLTVPSHSPKRERYQRGAPNTIRHSQHDLWADLCDQRIVPQSSPVFRVDAPAILSAQTPVEFACQVGITSHRQKHSSVLGKKQDPLRARQPRMHLQPPRLAPARASLCTAYHCYRSPNRYFKRTLKPCP